jgi:hypothetical protein
LEVISYQNFIKKVLALFFSNEILNIINILKEDKEIKDLKNNLEENK